VKEKKRKKRKRKKGRDSDFSSQWTGNTNQNKILRRWIFFFKMRSWGKQNIEKLGKNSQNESTDTTTSGHLHHTTRSAFEPKPQK
jgi:hypothetical protein